MKDDWIKIRTSLPNDNRTLRLVWELCSDDHPLQAHLAAINPGAASKLALPDALLKVTVVGALSVVWGNIRHQGVALPGGDCLLEGANCVAIDIITGIRGFGESMVKVGWCHAEKDGLVFPDFFGDFNTIPRRTPMTNAEKAKAYRERQKAKTGNAKDKKNGARSSVTKTDTPISLRERDKKKEKTSSFPKKVELRKQIPPPIEAVRAYCAERGNNIDADLFCDHYQARDWMAGKSRMKDWQAAVRTWERQRHAGSRQTGQQSGKTTAREHNQQLSDFFTRELDKELGGT